MTVHTVTAFFDDRKHAEEAAVLLKRAGLSDTSLTLSPSDARDEFATFDPLGAGTPGRKGFWGMLEELFGGSDDHQLYAEGVRRGGTMLTARVDDDQLDDAVEILDRHGSIDLEEREVSWRNDGWVGGSIGMPPDATITPGALEPRMSVAPPIMPPPVEPAPVVTPASFAVSSPVEAPVTLPDAAAASDSRPADVDPLDSDVLQVLEERLVVGKRAVSRGKVRVHSHVVERPVVEEVRLRDETIRVDRQAVDRTLTTDELNMAGFEDRTLEMEEVDEEAVVSKTARVVEEIELRKDVSARTETIHDSVRSTKVDIDDSRRAGAADAAAAPSALAGGANDKTV